MAARRRVLIVEDDPLVSTCVEEMLLGSGFDVTCIAGSASAALAAAEADPPDIALLDIRLAGEIDGVELACLLRTKFSVPAVFLSGVADPEILQRAALARPLGFLEKPVRPSHVFNAIEEALCSLAGDREG